MKFLRALPKDGWRRTGAVNIILASICGFIILASLLVSVAHNESDSRLRSTTIHEGDCDYTSKLSIALHILINSVSTAILASSNFFMQIVTSPTRKEIDHAHMLLRPLHIGLPSWRNLSSLPIFKRACWLLLFLSSIPLHLFFNSAIYKTGYQDEIYNLTIATPAFIQNQSYWLPGASLVPAGAFSPVQIEWNISNSRSPMGTNRSVYLDHGYPIEGYGEAVGIEDYWNPSSDASRFIGEISQLASQWASLSAEDCMKEYRSYSYRSKYTDLLILVYGGTSNPNGWLRNEVFEFDPLTNLTKFWDPRVPPDQVNPLWYWTQCTVSPSSSYHGSINNCGKILGISVHGSEHHSVDKTKHFMFSDGDAYVGIIANETERGYRAIRPELDIKSCLAKKVETCQVQLSNGLLLLVLSCVLVKVVTCIIILWNQQDASLVTPGDAIESFITNPDIYTRGLATLNITDSRNLQCSPRTEISSELASGSSTVRPRRWQQSPRRLYATISKAMRIQVYFPTSIFLAFFCTGAIMSMSLSPILPSFGPSEQLEIIDLLQGLGYFATLLVVNIPQLILSFVYLIVNLLHTNMQIEKEWNSYGSAMKPLRVSHPRGQQTSTYRLQLPYKYSIPLLITSALLHWVLSNCLFIVIISGRTLSGYLQTNDRLRHEFGLPEGTMVTAAYSNVAIITLFGLSLLFVLSPMFFTRQKLKSDMTFGATDSLVLSAACHPPLPERNMQDQDTNAPASVAEDKFVRPKERSPALSSVEEYEGVRDEGTTTVRSALVEQESGENDKEYLIALSRRPLRWGVTSLPTDLARELSTEYDEPVMHLSFGSEEHDVGEPQVGALYA